ncbi:histidine phosphatase family protein [Nonomuraea glycinis]|uniref:phosphoglycerate mutase (2,3-diphosphoglycerate-dependent) n=1 Tax=Nonomuraea glycinis TaxID=2047744 RepID=A0A918ADH6_9ACTN|nr:histidine phosphatase family protein [Nonomuraea glycinis]MCA2182469.1 histidine phosphatase family protein [Nonomuraea glycinis]GGP16252.1 phosphoglycerate mutase [Nonomuraea glycinis]
MGPVRIVAVRHGESEANVAYRQAGDDPLVYERGDDEVTLTGVGRTQAAALGRLLAGLPAAETPELVWCSPYLRARETWAVAQETWGAGALPLTVDERLRDREWGLLAPYNEAAIERRFPEELARLRAEGEYRYRPPQGESFADVAARLRDLLTDLRARARGQRVLIVAHDSVVLVLRHVIDEAPDAELAALAEFAPILNASVSTWHATDGRLTLLHYNTVHHLEP